MPDRYAKLVSQPEPYLDKPFLIAIWFSYYKQQDRETSQNEDLKNLMCKIEFRWKKRTLMIFSLKAVLLFTTGYTCM